MKKPMEEPPLLRHKWVAMVIPLIMLILLVAVYLLISNKFKQEQPKPKTNTQVEDFKKYLLVENKIKEFPQGNKEVAQNSIITLPPTQIVQTENRCKFSEAIERWRPLVSQYDWNVDEALLVISRESGGNEMAVSSTEDYGLFQLHQNPIFDPAENIKAAYYEYYLKRGWRPWYSVPELW